MTAPLYRADVQLGLGLVATITITEREPEPPPQSGAEWAREIDWPIAELTLVLPSVRIAGLGVLHPALRANIKVGGAVLDENWHSYVDRNNPTAGRRWTTTERAEYLDDAVATLRARAESELAPLIAHVSKRAARLAERETTLARGRAGRPRPTEATPELPIETDDTPRASAPPLTDDDASRRFALLELDPPRGKRAQGRN